MSIEDKLGEEIGKALREMRKCPSCVLKKLEGIVDRASAASLTMVQIRALFAIVQAYALLGHLKKMRSYANKAIALGDRLTNDYDRAQYFAMMGTYCASQHNVNAAMQYLTHALQFFEETRETDSSLYVQALMNMGRSFAQVGAYESALEYLHHALRVAKSQQDGSVATVLLNIGDTYLGASAFDRALEYYEEALSHSRRTSDSMGHCMALSSAASIYVRHHEAEKALEYLQEALELEARLQIREERTVILLMLGCAYGKLGDFRAAFRSLDKAEEMARAEGSNLLVKILWNQGVVLSDAGDLRGALEKLQEAIECVSPKKEPVVVADLYKDMGILCEHLGEAGQALVYYGHHNRLREESIDGERRRALERIELEQVHQSARKEWKELRLRIQNTEREMVRQRNELNTATIQLTRQNRLLQSLRDNLEEFRGKSRGRAREMAKTLLEQIDEAAEDADARQIFDKYFENAYENFIDELRNQGPQLTPTEIKICVLLRMNMPNKQIADVLFCSPLTIKTHRRNIRRKLNVPTGENLTSRLLAF